MHVPDPGANVCVCGGGGGGGEIISEHVKTFETSVQTTCSGSENDKEGRDSDGDSHEITSWEFSVALGSI